MSVFPLDFALHTFIAMISARVMMMESWIRASLFPSSLIMKDPTSQVNNKRRHPNSAMPRKLEDITKTLKKESEEHGSKK